MEEKKQKKSSIKGFLSIGEVFTYFFRKKDPSNKPDINLKMMHGVNKFSIIIFLLGIILFIVKRLFFQI